MSDKFPRPPRFTTSSGLFIMTLLFVGTVIYSYQSYYVRQRKQVPIDQNKTNSIIYVKAGENLQSILENLQGPAKVVLAAAKFSFDDTLYLQGKKNIEIKGAKSTIVECNSGSVFILENCLNFHMENFAIKCGSPEQNAIRIMYGRKVSMSGLHFQTSGLAVSINRAPDDANKKSQAIKLVKCSIDGTIEIIDSEQINIAKNKMMAPKQVPILSIRDSSGIVLEGNDVKTYEGFYLANLKQAKQPNGNRIAGNNFTTISYALKMEDSSDFSLESNHIKAQQNAVQLNHCTNISIGGKAKTGEQRNKFKSTGSHALVLSGCKRINVVDALFLNGPEAMTETVLCEFCEQVDFFKSQIAGFVERKEKIEAHGGGILIQKSNRITVKQSQIYDGYNNGIQVKGSSKIKILYSTIKQNMQEGIVIDSSQAVIRSNKIYQNNIGVQLLMSHEGTNVIGNQIFNNSSSGIVMDKAAPQIFKNEIKENLANGIELKKSKPILINNSIVNNQGFGIWKDKLSDIAKNQDNRISGNKMGDIK